MIGAICAGATQFPYLAMTGVPALLPFSPGVAWAMLAGFEWGVVLLYFTAASLLVLGVSIALKNAPTEAGALQKIILCGPVFIAMPMAVFGLDHYLDPIGVGRIIPNWIPAHTFWVYLVGTCLILGGLSIVFRTYAALSAGLFGVMLLCFEILMHIPRVVAAPHNRLVWAVPLRDFCFSWGALSFAAAGMSVWRTRDARWIISLARSLMGITVIVFAGEYLLHPELLPGVPLRQLTPDFIPGRLLWGYVTSVVYVAAGVCLLINKKARLAATWMGLFVLFTVIAFCVPFMLQNASNMGSAGSGLNVPVDTLLLSGALFCLAASLREEDWSPAKTQSTTATQHAHTT
jgi:uncharacterized membrane protein